MTNSSLFSKIPTHTKHLDKTLIPSCFLKVAFIISDKIFHKSLDTSTAHSTGENQISSLYSR